MQYVVETSREPRAAESRVPRPASQLPRPEKVRLVNGNPNRGVWFMLYFQLIKGLGNTTHHGCARDVYHDTSSVVGTCYWGSGGYTSRGVCLGLYSGLMIYVIFGFIFHKLAFCGLIILKLLGLSLL